MNSDLRLKQLWRTVEELKDRVGQLEDVLAWPTDEDEEFIDDADELPIKRGKCAPSQHAG